MPSHATQHYQRYIQRVKSNPLAATVKRADIKDHLTPSVDGRPGWLEQNHPDLHERYQKALQELGQWKVFGKDAFDVEAEMYPLGEYITENEAAEVAYKYLRELEEKQSTSSSGGQRLGGIQDRVFIQSPTGKLMRVMPEQGGKE